MSVTLSEVKRAAKAHRAPLAGESAGYLVLALADQVLSAPRLVQASEVQLTEEGALRVLSGRASSEVEAELSLRQALDQLLLVASSGSPALSRAGRRTSPSGLSSLVRELEAALIPVNRAAAKRALARVHRETQRALQSGVLPPEEVSAPVVVAPVAPVAVAVVAVVAPAPTPVEVAVEVEVEAPVATATAAEELGRVLSALCDELAAPPQLEESDALTIALAVRELSAPPPPAVMAAEPAPEAHEPEAVDSAAAPTVMRAVAVAPIALTPAPELPLEACTRPEPVVMRKSQHPVALPPAPTSEPLVRTPTLGSLAASLPVLSAERIATLDAEAEAERDRVQEAEICEPIPDLVLPHLVEDVDVDVDSDELQTSIAPAVFEAISPDTEALPEVAPLSPGVAMIESKKSDVSELLASFRVGGQRELDGLPRAIKEMAELDLTPAPFAALIR